MRALNNYMCLWSLATACSAIAYCDDLDLGPPSVGETPESITREWMALGATDLSEDNRIESVEFVLQHSGFFGADNLVTFTAEIEDRAFLDLLTQALQDIRVLYPIEYNNLAGSNPRLGHLTVKTTRGKLRVYVHEDSFYLITKDRDGIGTYSKFYSTSLATLLEAFLEREGRLQSSKFRYKSLTDGFYSVSGFFKKTLAEMHGLRDGRIVNKVGDVDFEKVDPRQGKPLWQTVADYNKAREADSAWLVMEADGARELCVLLDNKEVLSLLADAVRIMTTTLPRATDKPCDSRPIGQLVLTQPDGYVEVDIHPTFFRLVTVPKEFLGSSKVFAFHSPYLANLIDAIRASAGVPPFSDEQREALCGEAYNKARRAAMLDLIAKTPSLRREETAPQESTK